MLLNAGLIGSNAGGDNWTLTGITTALWLDGADNTTMTIDGFGRVEEWRDKSGNNRHMEQPSASNRPTLANAVYNELNTVQFNGSNNRLNMVSGGLNLARNVSALTIFHVVEIFTGSSSNANILRISPPTSNAIRNSAGVETLGYRRLDTDTFTSVNYGLNPAVDTLVMTSHITDYGNGLAFVSRNGSDINQYTSLISSGTTSHTNSAGIWMGASNTVNSQNIHGRICEVIVLQSVPTTSDRQKIEGYLAHKWGLSANLPSNHPYKNNPPYI